MIEQDSNYRILIERLRKGIGNGNNVGDEELKRQIDELRRQNNELYVKKEQNDQLYIETNQKLQSREHQCAQLRSRLSNQEQEAKKLHGIIERLQEECKAKELLHDENLSLKLLCGKLEDKNRKLTAENTRFVEQLKAGAQGDVDLINELNKEIERLKGERLSSRVSSAAGQPSAFPPVDKQLSLNCDIPGALTAIPKRCLLKFEAHDGEINALKWFSTGHSLVTGGSSDRKIKIWDFSGNRSQLKGTLTGCNASITSIDLNDDDSLLLAGCNDYAARVWSTTNHQCKSTLTGHGNKVTSAKFFKDGSRAATGSFDRTAKMWDLRGNRCTKTFFPGSTVSDLVVTEGAIISGHFDKNLRFWDTRSSDPFKVITLDGKVTSLDISHDGNLLLSCTRNDNLNLLDLRMSKILHYYSGESFRVGSDLCRASLSPDQSYCICGSADGQLFVWNVDSTKIEQILTREHDGHSVIATSWNKSGQFVASSDRNRAVCIWSS